MGETATATFDVRDLLNEGRRRQREESDWVAEHAGALAASRLGGCLRREKFRIMGLPGEETLTPRQERRLAAGVLFEENVYKTLLAAGRRPRRHLKLQVEIEGVTIRGTADLVMPEAVVEVKTTERWTLHGDHLPFANLMQLGTYMYALQKPGQLLYIGHMGAEEWTFDFPSIPDMWEPWAQQVARLFRENPGPDPTPFPSERLWCASCPYQAVCPPDVAGAESVPLGKEQAELLTLTAKRYDAAREDRLAAEHEEEGAKVALLGYRHLMRTDAKGVSVFEGPNLKVKIAERSTTRLDQKAAKGLLEGAGLEVPTTTSTYPVVTVATEDE